jgi:hypothetical protein
VSIVQQNTRRNPADRVINITGTIRMWRRASVCGLASRLICPEDLPMGKITNFCQTLGLKYSDLQKLNISCISISSFPPEGRLKIVTDAGKDAMDAGRLTTLA